MLKGEHGLRSIMRVADSAFGCRCSLRTPAAASALDGECRAAAIGMRNRRCDAKKMSNVTDRLLPRFLQPGKKKRNYLYLIVRPGDRIVSD